MTPDTLRETLRILHDVSELDDIELDALAHRTAQTSRLGRAARALQRFRAARSPEADVLPILRRWE